MKTTRKQNLGAALACAVALNTTQAQTPASESVQVPIPKTAAALAKAKEGMVKLANSGIQYFSQGEGETIVLLPEGFSPSVTWTAWRRHSPRRGTVS